MKKFLFCLYLILINKILIAGGWQQMKENNFYQFGLSFINAEEFFDINGEEIPLNGIFTDISTNIFANYFLSGRFSVFADVTAFRYSEFETDPGPDYERERVSGIGDALAGFNYFILKSDQTKIGAGLSINLPLGKSSPDNSLFTGPGDFYQGINFSLKHILYPLPVFLSATVSFNNRTEGYSDEFFYHVETGYFLYTDVTITLKVNGIQPMYNGKNNKRGGFGIFLNEKKFISAGGEISYKFSDDWGLTINYIHPVIGKNLVSSPVYSFGIFYEVSI